MTFSDVSRFKNFRNVACQEFSRLDSTCLVKITHNRLFTGMTSEPDPAYMSRSRFEKKCGAFFNITNHISATCGYTTVEFVINGITYTGKYSFGKRQFCRPLGAMVAIRRALSKTEAGLEILSRIEGSLKESVPMGIAA